MIPNVPVTHGNETAHRRLLGGAVNWILNLFSGLSDSTSGQALTSDGNGGVQWGGNIVMADGEGIDFSASEGSGASSSILDDYEEGTFTPVVKFGATTATTTALAKQTYTKIGQFVIAHYGFRIDNLNSGTGNMSVSDPFAASNSYKHGWGQLIANVGFTQSSNVQFYNDLLYYPSATSHAPVTHANISATNTAFYGCKIYTTD